MTQSYIGAVWLFGGNFAPLNFAFCSGQLQPISENAALFQLLGTTYGGDGVSTFALPDLRGRVVIGQGTGPGLPNYVEGQVSGTESVTVTSNQMAQHSHLLNVGVANATSQTPTNSLFINQVVNSSSNVATNFFSDQPANATLISGSISATGSNIPIDIIQPITAISYVIALFGIFPPQS